MKSDLVEKNAQAIVSRTVRKVETSAETEMLSVHRFVTEPAVVSLDYALTINLGNYESAKVSVSVSMPCYKEEIDDAYEFVQAWVEERVGREKEAITGVGV